MESKLNYKRTFFIGLAFLSISAFWQMYDNIIPLILQNTFQIGETVTGFIMALDNVLAVFLLPVFGALSDRADTPFGKRIPFIVCGTVLAVIFMLILPYVDRAGSIVLFVVALFLTLLSMGLYRSPAVALMPDLTPNRLRSRANAVINLMGAVGGVYALIMIRLLVGKGERPDYRPLFFSIAILMAAAVAVLVITIPEKKLKEKLAAELAEDSRKEDLPGQENKTGTSLQDTEKEISKGVGGSAETSGQAAEKEISRQPDGILEQNAEKDIKQAAEKEISRQSDGILEQNAEKEIKQAAEKEIRQVAEKEIRQAAEKEAASRPGMPKEKYLRKENPLKFDLPRDVMRSMVFMLLSIFFWFTAYNAVTTAFSRYTRVVWKMEGGSFANCLMVATVAAILSYIPIGHVSSKFGRKKTIMGGVLLMAACYGAAIFVGEYHPLINVAFALIGVAWAAINVNSYPMIVAMSQGGDIGKFTGTYYTFSMAAQIFTPILSGFLLENVSYRTLFPYALVFSLIAFLTMTQVRHGDVKPAKKESLLENFDVDD